MVVVVAAVEVVWLDPRRELVGRWVEVYIVALESDHLLLLIEVL